MSKAGWLFNTILLLLIGAFIGYVAIPIIKPDIAGTPVSWLVTGVGTVIMFFFMTILLWLRSRASQNEG